jgi:uncharacterized protein (TIGR02452 family)
MTKRSHLGEMGHETLAVLQAGCYDSPSGKRVHIAQEVEYARTNSRLYRPDEFPDGMPAPLAGPNGTVIEVTEESTLAAARRLEAENPCCLNFASARHPGGGFLSGARAQEESLARASALYPCIVQMNEMYSFNRARKTCLYSDYMIYSPRVPVFRDGEGTLLETPYFTSFLTAAAVNAGALHDDERPLIEPVMRQRTEKLLRAMHHQGHATLVLGAWGCGAFRNEADTIARIFADLLHPGGVFHNVFGHAVFAILSYPKDKDNLETFRRRLM